MGRRPSKVHPRITLRSRGCPRRFTFVTYLWSMRTQSGSYRRSRMFAAVASGCAVLALSVFPITAANATSRPNPDHVGLTPGTIKHVWLIILENKSYDATFSGLNHNTYLWKTLTAQGVLLKNYYGTGHFSLDNYVSLVSGQATEPDTQSDCPYYDSFSTTATLGSGGQAVSAAGPNATAGTNGCVYPSDVQTLFNQLDTAGVSWKGYAQDLDNPDTNSAGTGPGQTHSVGPQACGAPYSTPGPTGSTAYPNPGAANATDQYVPKHFPFPWFESLLQNSNDCNSTHIANLDDASDGLYHDLQSEATTPAFSWITPDNCSDAHDAVCHGNNLSGGWASPITPLPPKNYTGGLYASDLFLEHYIPMIERSPAFKDGGLIDITFDEAFPPFTYTGNSFSNATNEPATAATSIMDDSAGENINGKNVHYEPTGPNTPLAVNTQGDQLYPGPGDNAYVDRDSSIPGLILGGGSPIGGSATGGARTDTATGNPGTSEIDDNSITLTDEGRTVTGTNIPPGCIVGPVTDTHVGATAPSQSGGLVDTGSFVLTCNGVAQAPTGDITSINLGPETASSDPLFDAKDATTGGGDTGSVLISPFITPGTSTTTFYNHYSWLRTMEDLFGITTGGSDGHGHLGYAGQAGLQPFGTDVFNNPSGTNPSPWIPKSAEWPVAGIGVTGGYFALRRRR